MAKYAMLFNVKTCSGCYNCVLACKDENCGNDHLPLSVSQPETGHFWMNLVEQERGQFPRVKVASIPVTCMQCEDAPCMTQAYEGAVYRRRDGVVVIDPVKAKGQKHLVDACPYGVIYWNEQEQVAQKCTMCSHLMDAGWTEPRCVQSCPVDAIVFGDVDDPNSAISKALAESNAEILYPEKGLEARNKYVGLPKKFVAGTLRYGDIDECAENVKVKVKGNGLTQETTSNAFGDFEFEGLADNGKYEISFTKRGFEAQKLTVTCDRDVYVGKIVLNRRAKKAPAGV